MDNQTLYKRIGGMALATTLIIACVSFVISSFELLPERTLIVPGLSLPNVEKVEKRVRDDEFVHASSGSEAPRLVCATLQFQRTVFFIRETGYLSQVRTAAFPFGYAHIGMRIPVQKTQRAPSDAPALAYLSDYYAVSSGAFLLWFDGLQQLSLHPLAIFLYLLPQALIFSIACGLTRVLVDGCTDWSAQVVLPPLLFGGWLVLAVWTTDDPSASDKGIPWRQLVPEILAWGTCALGIGLGVRPWGNLVPKTAVFVLVSIAACLLANIVLAFALAATSKLQVRNDIDINDINSVRIVQIELYALALAMGQEAEPPPELESLADWNEVCPPFRRIVGGALPAPSDGPVREGHP